MKKRITFVIGNGESRQPIDLDSCKNQGVTVGCNAIVRDFYPDIVSAADQRMVAEVLSSDYPGQLYTRPNWNIKFMVSAYPELPYNGTTRADNPWHWNSGPHAINIACAFKNYEWNMQTTDLCYLIGFDMTQQNNYTNVYANTNGYDNKAVDPKYWHHQLDKLFESYPHVNFVWIAPAEYECPKQWHRHANFSRDTTQNFNKYLHDT